MKELFATGDPVILSVLRHDLSEAEIAFDVFDSYTDGLFPGIGLATTRVMVDDDDFSRAKVLLNEIKKENGLE